MEITMTALPRLACCISLALTLPATAHAVVHCVDTPAALAIALEVAETNGVDDDVRVVAGHYDLPATLVHSTHEAFAFSLSGGWNAVSLTISPVSGLTSV